MTKRPNEFTNEFGVEMALHIADAASHSINACGLMLDLLRITWPFPDTARVEKTLKLLQTAALDAEQLLLRLRAASNLTN